MRKFLFAFAVSACTAASAQNVLDTANQRQPHEYGVFAQYGNGVTDNRNAYHFLAAGLSAGRVLTNNHGAGLFRFNFEYAAEVLPYWQSFTPKFQRVRITPIAGSSLVNVSAPYAVGGTFTGASITPIILRLNFPGRGKFSPWMQAAGGLLWTNHKYPAYGSTDPLNLTQNGPNGETSVWNFTPQGGIGVHYFTRKDRSIDFSVNAEHISSASLGDRNPGVNASLHFRVGYSWWK